MTPTLHPHLAALETALDRLTHNPQTRARGAWARDGHGKAVCPTSKRAETFCVLGDVLRHLGLTKKEAEQRLANTAPRALLLLSYQYALDALLVTIDKGRKVQIGEHIDTLSDFDAAALVAHTILAEQLRLSPRSLVRKQTLTGGECPGTVGTKSSPRCPKGPSCRMFFPLPTRTTRPRPRRWFRPSRPPRC